MRLRLPGLSVALALLFAAPASANPLAGVSLFVDHQRPVARFAETYPELSLIARQPGAERFGNFSFGANGVPSITDAAQRFLRRVGAQEPGAVPLLATYRIVSGHCGRWSDTPEMVASYHQFIDGFAAGIGRTRAVLFLELDSIITMSCLTPQGQLVREAELRYAVQILRARCPRLAVYLDAGAGDALRARDAARFLRASGVAQTSGFLLNSTHYDWTMREIRYGWAISRMTRGAHFVVNTGDNGRGPLVPRDRVHQGNEVLCNPPGRGLGPLPTANTGFPRVDAFEWTTNPGESGGTCSPGAPPQGSYWPAYGLMLARNAHFSVR